MGARFCRLGLPVRSGTRTLGRGLAEVESAGSNHCESRVAHAVMLQWWRPNLVAQPEGNSRGVGGFKGRKLLDRAA